MPEKWGQCDFCGEEGFLDDGLRVACRWALAHKVEDKIKSEKIQAIIDWQNDNNYWDG